MTFIVIAATALTLLRDEPVAAGETPASARAAVALHRFVTAVQDEDPTAARGASPPEDVAAADVLAQLAANARELRVVDFGARYVGPPDDVEPSGSWTASVELSWRFAGFDRAVVRSDVLARFEGTGEGTGLVGFESAPLWLTAPLSVVRGPDSLVLVQGDDARAAQLARQVEKARGVLRRTLPHWHAPVVVEVAASDDVLDSILHSAEGTHAGAAAVTAQVASSAGPSMPAHVFVNREVADALGAAELRAVLSHELAHLATMAPTSEAPLWLSEGLADYVALRPIVPNRTTLPQAVALVRQRGVPKSWPGHTEFDAGGDRQEAAYQQAWLSCWLLAERLGVDGLVTLHRRVGRGVPFTRALRRAGLSKEQLRREWRTRLQDLAG